MRNSFDLASIRRGSLLGCHILVRKCLNADQVADGYTINGIYVPDKHAKRTQYVELIDCGPKCLLVTKDMCAWHCPSGIGVTLLCCEATESLCSVDDSLTYWMLKEHELVITEGKKKKPRFLIEQATFD